ncbi:inactive serine/threonine-protein kinase VRK3 [Nematolebias whitei]|uniref:inactive serine/threonine-protein kinase VRK3 n=1 Tax=Nematolebias whitei TaxID=451745 RepID=UPI00189746B6|nr:inactive serine/threonine-protein kinase VRK3 [Nematolebias whitei]
MPFSFCPQCGTKLQPGFKFCPWCGEKLPCFADETGFSTSSASLKHEATTSVNTSPASPCESTKRKASFISTVVSPRPALKKTRNSLRLEKEVHFSIQDVSTHMVSSTNPAGNDMTPDKSVSVPGSPSTLHTAVVKADVEMEAPVVKSPRCVRGKGKVLSPAKEEAEEKKSEGSTAGGLVPSPISKFPSKGRSKAKKAKHAVTVEPLQEGEEVTDTTGKKWKLMKLLSRSMAELLYEVSRPGLKESDHVLKLGAKEGRIFNEQNFLQRAAKPATVDKWVKQNKMDFLGIPSCVGFGLHADSYRFLIFPNMGRSLHSVIEEENKLLSEEDVLQLTCRILDVLQFMHSNEYVHADISAENVYIKQKSQVLLVGYCHAFRFCPGGQHVEYREASRTAHEGTVEFISLDAHKGAAPSRRSDLQSLGYCMLHWHTGTLPWSELTEPDQVAAQKQRYMEDVKALMSHCFGKKKVSNAFQAYLSTVMSLQYSEQPNYSELKAGLCAALQKLGGSMERPLSL